MLEELEARQRILSTTPAPEPEVVALQEANGRYLFDEIFARVALPGFDQSAMDGYAVRSADVGAGQTRLKVVATHAAGSGGGGAIGAGEAARVFTGAPLPAGADAVVMQEYVRRSGDEIVLLEAVQPGEFVRRAGEIVCRGQRIAGRGARIDPATIGLLASQGLTEVTVGRAPRVTLITTGDELVPPGPQQLAPGQIYNSNAPMLRAALERVAGVRVRCAHARDDLAATTAALEAALAESDVVIFAGGVSVGDRDFVKPALAACDIEPEFWRVRVKPGKPLLYALAPGGRQIVGLPGNPVSALVCLVVFALPALRRRCGAGDAEAANQTWCAPAAVELSNRGDRPHYLRGRVLGDGRFHPVPQQVSHGLLGLAEANALVRLDAGATIPADTMVPILTL